MELGYRFAPPEYPHSPGSPRLEINIYEVPAMQHYDPEQLMLKVVNDDGNPDSLTVSHLWPLGDETYHVCVGYVILNDRNGNKVIAYALGGELQIKKKNDKTQCILESKAPILRIGKMFAIPSLLADEIEILIAERAATRLTDLATHQKRLASADPMDLYATCLNALEDKYGALEHQELAHVIEFRNFMANEITALHEISRWPVSVPALEELI